MANRNSAFLDFRTSTKITGAAGAEFLILLDALFGILHKGDCHTMCAKSPTKLSEFGLPTKEPVFRNWTVVPVTHLPYLLN